MSSETTVIVVCPQRRLFWYLDAEPAKCTEPSHQHARHETHRHLDTVRLPDGAQVTAASFHALDPYTRDRRPDYGLYLDHRWQPPWPHDHLDWPDFAVPADPAPVMAALRSVHARARAGARLEVGCLGGHGRTGTALALLAVLAGQPSGDAVEWVRSQYCPAAVETTAQKEFVAAQRK